jgi:hypothetical protein
MKYIAFISYRHSVSSRTHAERLESALKRYAKPVLRPPIAIFRDERVLRPGDDLPAVLRAALENSEYLVYIADQQGAASHWVRDELRIWCSELGRAQRLIIVHIGDRITVDPDTQAIVWSETDALPPVLQGVIPTLPLWVDLSWATTPEQRDLNNVEYKKQVNAIVAKFRGRTPGEMNDEEVLQHRRNVRARNLAVAAVVLFALMATGFGIRAYIDRRQSEIDRRQAVADRKQAVADRGRAEANAGIAESRRRDANVQRQAAQANERKARNQEQIANTQRRLAEQQRDLAIAQQLAIGAPTYDPDLHTLLLAESLRRAPTALGLEQAWKVDRETLRAVARLDYPPGIAVEPDGPSVYEKLPFIPAPITGLGTLPGGDLVVTSRKADPYFHWGMPPEYAWFATLRRTRTGFRPMQLQRFPRGGPLTTATSGEVVAVADKALVRVYEALRTAEPIQVLSHDTPVKWLALSSDGRRLAVLTEDDRLRLYERGSAYSMVREHALHGTIVAHLWDAEWPALVTRDDDRLSLFESSGGTSTAIPVALAATDDVIALGGAGRRAYVAVGGKTGHVRLLIGNETPEWDVPKDGADAPVSALAFSQSAVQLGVGFADGTACVIDVSTGRKRGCTRSKGPIAHIGFGPQGDEISVANGAATVVFALDPRQRSPRTQVSRDAASRVFALTNSTRMIVCTREAIALVGEDGKQLWSRPTESFCDLAITHDDRLMAVSVPGGLLVRRLTDGVEATVRIEDPKHGPWSEVSFGRGGRMVTATWESAWAMDIREGTRSLQVSRPYEIADLVAPVTVTATSPSGDQLAVSKETRLQLFSTITQRELTNPDRFDFLNAVAYRPDGKQLVLGAENELRVLNPADGRTIWRVSNYEVEPQGGAKPGAFLEYLSREQTRMADRLSTTRQLGRVISLDYAYHNQFVVAGTSTGNVGVFDAATGRTVVVLPMGKCVMSVRGAADTRQVNVAVVDGAPLGLCQGNDQSKGAAAAYAAVERFSFDAAELSARLCQKVTRDITAHEWSQFLRGLPFRSVCSTWNRYAFAPDVP